MILNDTWDKGYSDPTGWAGFYPTDKEGFYFEIFETMSNQPEEEDQPENGPRFVGGVYYKLIILGRYADGTYCAKEDEDVESLYYYCDDTTLNDFKDWLEENEGYILGEKITEGEIYKVLVDECL